MGILLAASRGGDAIAALVLLVLFGLGVAYCAYYGIQSWGQGSALGEPIAFHQLSARAGQVVALRGRPELVQQHSDPFKSRCLWVKTIYQSWHSGWGGGRRGWHTTQTETEGFEFVLRQGEASVTVLANEATEVHGSQGESTGLGMVFAINTHGSDHRVRHRRLLLSPLLTVCGKLIRTSDGFVLTRDDDAGLLLSPRSTEAQAVREKLKAVLGLLVLPACWALAALWCIRNVF